MNNFLKYGFFAALCLAGLLRLDAAGAQGLYQTELSTGFSLSDDEGNNETKVYALSGRHYFSPVDPAGHPLKEAAFLERVGRFEFVFAMSDLRFASSRTAGGPFYGGSVFYMQPGFPLLLSTGFTQSDLEFDPPQASDLSVNTYDLSFGYFFGPGFVVGFGYTHSETEFSEPGLPNRVDEGDDYTLSTKWLHRIDRETALNIEGFIELSRFDETGNKGRNLTFGFLEEYYFNPRSSLGIGIDFNTGDDKAEEGHALSVFTTVFINPAFSVTFAFEKFFADNIQGRNEDAFDFRLSARF